jgi:anti-sigma factor RsiW
MTVHCQEIVELVTDYLEGALDPDMTTEVEAHLQLCDGCDTYVEQMRDTIRALGKVPVATLSEKARAELVRAFRDMRGPTGPGLVDRGADTLTLPALSPSCVEQVVHQ